VAKLNSNLTLITICKRDPRTTQQHEHNANTGKDKRTQAHINNLAKHNLTDTVSNMKLHTHSAATLAVEDPLTAGITFSIVNSIA